MSSGTFPNGYFYAARAQPSRLVFISWWHTAYLWKRRIFL